MTLPFDIEFLYKLFLVSFRLGAMFFLVPVFSMRSIPIAAKAALSFVFAGIVASLLPPVGALPLNAMAFIVAALQEIGAGLLMGMVIRIAFQVVNFAGELWGMQGNFTRDQTFDPISGGSSTATERLLYNFALVAFISMGLHLKVLGDFVASYNIAPLGGFLATQGMVNELIYRTSQIFVTGVQIAAPMIAVNFVINSTFAVLGKAAPQMNVFMVSFAVIIFAGLSLLMFGLNVVEGTVSDILKESAKNMLSVLQLQ